MSDNDEIHILEDPNKIEMDIMSVSNTNIIINDIPPEYIYNEMSEEYYNKISMSILRVFADYYGISKKGKKIDLIYNIIEFENDPRNQIIVDNCRKLWLNFNELKNNKVFSKYILKI